MTANGIDAYAPALDGGRTQPRFREGAGRLCLDYLRTLRYRGTPAVTEELADPEALIAWVRQCGPCSDVPATPPTPARLREARALREAVHALVSAAMAPGREPGAAPGSGLGDTARARLNRAAAHAVPAPRLAPSGDLQWHADDPLTATLALIARDALDLAATPELLPRLRPCASPTCGAVFLDQSRPGTRRWCSMDVCGNQAKKTALRARSA
ncbi:ABATE domain-containing protein [Streptomyces sp. NPDC008317]|uniref:CGNR zinc finger domain-containing protein n=1 Tax=Streptomyces sp. NPDC008317 TaxID=3364827 RepID=UPI0036E2C011